MYKVTKRDCPMFGIGPYVCEFICDTASDITTLPTSISEGTGGRTAYDNQKCASGSIAIVASGSESKQYMLNNQDIWCPYSVAAGSSSGGSGESSITVDFALSETSENPVANKTITAALNEKANASDLPDFSAYALKSKYGDTTIDVGRKADTTVGDYSTAEGHDTTASGKYSHAEGYNTTASGNHSHAEGYMTIASGNYSHAEGSATTASSIGSHAEGQNTTASGGYSHAGGIGTKALKSSEVAYGRYNVSNGDTLFSIGDGTNDDARHNAFEITRTGGTLHNKNIATTDDIPDLTQYAKTTDIPNIKVNSAVNADTVGGKDPGKIFYDNGMSSDLNNATKSGCYGASPDTINTPFSTWWLVETMNYNDQFIVQKAYTIGDATHTSVYVRNYANNAWSVWSEISTTSVVSTNTE